MDHVLASVRVLPASAAVSVSRAIDAWVAQRGRYPRFIVIEHELDGARLALLFASMTIAATDDLPPDRAGIWVLRLDAHPE